MAVGKTWMSLLKELFEKSPLWLNVFFGFVLLGLEKVVEVEFVCPCNPEWNHISAAAYFVVPAVVVFLLMMNIQGCKTDCCEPIKDVCYKCYKCKCDCDCIWTCCMSTFKAMCSSIVPSLVWLVLMFLDGRYFVCAKTDWSGRFVVVAEAAPQKWCKPTNQTSSEELMKKSQEFASCSQMWGMGLFMIFALPLLCTSCCYKKKDSDPEEGMELKASTVYKFNATGDVELTKN